MTTEINKNILFNFTVEETTENNLQDRNTILEFIKTYLINNENMVRFNIRKALIKDISIDWYTYDNITGISCKVKYLVIYTSSIFDEHTSYNKAAMYGAPNNTTVEKLEVMGYHIDNITKGEIGTIDKVQEEVDEFKDAIKQNSKIMCIVELSDIYGALEELAIKYNLTMDDLQNFSNITKRAFKDGSRV